MRFSEWTHLKQLYSNSLLSYSDPRDSHSPALLDLFISSDASICSTMTFPPLGNSDNVVVSVSIDFLINSKQDALFHCVAYDYSCGDWNGLCDHLRDVPSLNSVLLLLLVNSVSGFRLELMYIPLIVSISQTSPISMVFSSLCCCHSS